MSIHLSNHGLSGAGCTATLGVSTLVATKTPPALTVAFLDVSPHVGHGSPVGTASMLDPHRPQLIGTKTPWCPEPESATSPMDGVHLNAGYDTPERLVGETIEPLHDPSGTSDG